MLPKILLSFLFFAFSFVHVYAQDQYQYLAASAKVWGFLKYYHPEAGKGKDNWDSVLLKSYPNLKTASTKQEFNTHLLALMGTLHHYPSISELEVNRVKKAINSGQLQSLPSFKHLSDTTIYPIQPDFRWMNDSVFDPSVKEKLFALLWHHRQFKPKSIKGKVLIKHQENELPSFSEMTEGHRILSLFRYWNIVAYYYPYKRLLDKDWDHVLGEFIPIFMRSDSNYYFALNRLVSQIQDSHALMRYTMSPTKVDSMKQKAPQYLPPFQIRRVKDEFVISKILLDSLGQEVNLMVGDTLISINDRMLRKEYDSYQQTKAVSTPQSLLYNFEYDLPFYFWDDAFKVVIKRGSEFKSVSLDQGVNYQTYKRSYSKQSQPFLTIDDSVAYIDIGSISTKEFKKASKKVRTQKVLILDIRDYPQGMVTIRLAKLLHDHPQPVAVYDYPEARFPGCFRRSKKPLTYFVENNFALFIKSIGLFESKKIFPTQKPFQGRLVVLIDGGTISQSETIGMLIHAYGEHVTFIGRPTAGANGDVVFVNLPGQVRTSYSSIDFHYPDGKQLQRKGIQPDIYVTPKVNPDGKDEIMERALEFIRGN